MTHHWNNPTIKFCPYQHFFSNQLSVSWQSLLPCTHVMLSLHRRPKNHDSVFYFLFYCYYFNVGILAFLCVVSSSIIASVVRCYFFNYRWRLALFLLQLFFGGWYVVFLLIVVGVVLCFFVNYRWCRALCLL